jgi:hypothetical protein
MRYRDPRHHGGSPNGLRTFGRWIQTRPLESWGFFAAGFVIARILF